MHNESISNETRLTRIQALVVEILNDLLRAPIEQTDRAVDEAMSRLGAYCVRDRVYVFVHDGDVTNNTHEWCADGIDPMIEHLQGLPIELYGPIAETLDRGDHFHVPDVSLLPEGSPSRAILESQEIRSILLVPMRWEDQTYGFVGFDGVRNTHTFLPGELYLLQSVADVICSVLVRRQRDKEMRAAKNALDRERAFLASILATSAMGIVVLDEEGAIRFANDAAETVLGATRAEMIGVAHDDPSWRYAQESGEPFPKGQTPFERVMATGQPVSDERFLLDCPDGIRFCSVHAAPIQGETDNNARVVYALLDVTDQVKADVARQEALDEARRANAAKSSFLAKMSHEMRTPLNGVLGVAEVLQTLTQDPDQKRMIKVMHDSGALLLNIINDLLDMSKIEADQLVLEAVPFVPADIAQRIESVHTLKASEKQVSFAVTIEGDGTQKRLGDPHRILQILHNVLSNAVKFTETGAISVLVDCSNPSGLDLTVVDTGIGMEPEQIQHVFEEFGQADSSISRRFGGTGLGMPIVRRLVEMMNGTITLNSKPGQGTTVSIHLPLPLTQVDTPLGAGAGHEEVTADLRGLRVLAADDNRTNRMILGAMMGQLGIATVLTSDGAEALDAYEREEFDMVILDISMPGMDGMAVLREIRAREAQRAARSGRAPKTSLPVLAFTANAMSHQIESYLEAGFDDCLTKPLQLEKLSRCLSAQMTERGWPVSRRHDASVVSLRSRHAH